MNAHLSEDQVTEFMLGTSDEVARRHLETCGACCLEVEELRRAVCDFRDSVHAAAERDQNFWSRQQIELRSQISASDWSFLHWVWVAAMVMVLIAAIFLARPRNLAPLSATEDADKALLQQVQGDLGRDVPQALAPAVLIAEERNGILTNKVTQNPRLR